MTKLHKTNNSISFRKDNKIYVLVKTDNGLKIFNVKEDDVDWITVRGNHIPVKKGQSKEEAVKSFIEGKKGIGKKEDGSGSGKTSIKKDLIEVDSLAKKIKKDASYEDVLERPWDVYDITGIKDSGLREEIFIAISDKYNVKYDDLYNAWLNGRWDKGKEKENTGTGETEKGKIPSGIKFKEFVDKAGEKSMRALIERNGGKVDAKKEDGFVSGKIYAPEGKKIRGTKEDIFASFEVREEDFEDFVNKRLGKDSKYFEERSEGGSDKGNKEQDYTSSRFFRSVFTPFSVDKNDKKTYRPAIESAENDLKNKIQKEEDWLKKQEGSKNYWIYKIRLDAMKKDLEKLKRFKEE